MLIMTVPPEYSIIIAEPYLWNNVKRELNQDFATFANTNVKSSPCRLFIRVESEENTELQQQQQQSYISCPEKFTIDKYIQREKIRNKK